MKNFKKLSMVMLIIVFVLQLSTFNVSADQEQPAICGDVAITMDMDTLEVIYSKDADVPHALASTTKLLTSLIFAENAKKEDLIYYTDYSSKLKETTLNYNFLGGSVIPGDSMTADDIMKSVLVFSANDAAILMAESVAGNIEDFAKIMNEKAREIGAINSNFVNPNGLELENNVYNTTTAYDLALIGIHAYKNDWIRETLGIKETSVTLKGFPIYIETRNKNLGENGNVGGKTGTETNAGHCFVGFYKKDNRNLVSVVLGSDYGADGTTVFNETNDIINYSFSAKKTVVKESNNNLKNLVLFYKLFGFFGPTKTIEAPLILSDNISMYDNSYNEKNSSIAVDNKDLNAWKIAKDNSVNIVYSSGSYKENHPGYIDISYKTLFDENLPIYVVFGSVILVIFIILIVILIGLSRNREKKNNDEECIIK